MKRVAFFITLLVCILVVSSCGTPWSSRPPEEPIVVDFESLLNLTGTITSAMSDFSETHVTQPSDGVTESLSEPSVPELGPNLRTGAVLSWSLRTEYDAMISEIIASWPSLDFWEQAAILQHHGNIFVRLAKEGMMEPKALLEFSDVTWEMYAPFVHVGGEYYPMGGCSTPVPGEYSPPCVFVDRRVWRVLVPDLPLWHFGGIRGDKAIMSYGIGGGCGGTVSHRLLDSSLSVISEIRHIQSDCGPLRTETFVRMDTASEFPLSPAVVLVFSDGDSSNQQCAAAGFLRDGEDWPDIDTIRDLRVFERPIPCEINVDYNLVRPDKPLRFVFDSKTHEFPSTDFSQFPGRWDQTGTGSILAWPE